ncbi:class I SAM-dependent methyltransferase [Rhodococcus rhodnii]|uniref:THUMP-like domain-containing protein n=2 Tax=Rhodococcus rhodnii TaxID=38312 RepID=R7WLX6_9NOCA|nr:hypothetical protein [Rhodococcus rhodnii]EOM76292.1 hypothetical protein Rrhod_2392 [Rhodococcus rhodnii LMG 5362]TXG90757.1 class I SAM-dependent methyltransferase [Rhodococcus rhodnii]
MGYSFTDDDLVVLTSPEGRDALRRVSDRPLTRQTLLADTAWARGEFGARAGALIETVLARRRASGKLDGAAEWLVTDDAVQQATATPVAARRARRIGARPVHDVTCSIGSEIAQLVQVSPLVVGSDLDPVRAAMARHNVPGAAVLRADALRPATRDVAVVADPGRRAGGRRKHDPAALDPPLPALLDVYGGRDLVVKCAPGLDFSSLDFAGEIEVVSLDGGVREACLWSAGFAEPGVTRRASVLRTVSGGGVDASGVHTEEITDAEPDDVPDGEPGEWIVDPDGAIVRAGLVRHWAARHGLWQLDPRIAYLTGDAVPAGVRGFRILDRVKFSDKELRRALARHDAGAVEILVRGVDVDPDALRVRMKTNGATPRSVVVTRLGRNAVAFVCEHGVVAAP